LIMGAKLNFREIMNPYMAHFRQDYFVKRMGLFGSFSRNEAHEDSDVDVLVEFNVQVGMFQFLRLQMELSTLFGRKVDLVTPKALKSVMKATVLKEAQWLEEL
jgi:uncharacterized protein